jgi:hypothetical protein
MIKESSNKLMFVAWRVTPGLNHTTIHPQSCGHRRQLPTALTAAQLEGIRNCGFEKLRFLARGCGYGNKINGLTHPGGG